MDAKITKLRLSRLLSYDWLKIIGLATAAIIFWALLFTMTATRIKPAQQFTVFNYTYNNALSDDFFNSYNNALSGGVFSYEVIEGNTNDLAISADMANTLLESRLATDEGDVLFIPDINDPSTATEDENGQTQYRYSYLESFAASWMPYIKNLSRTDERGFFKEMETYLNGYYTAGFAQADSLDENKVEADFRARIKANKDKRFKKEDKIAQGVQDEIARIKKYQKALVDFYGYLDKGYVQLTDITVYSWEDPETVILQGTYGINLCPAGSTTMKELSKLVGYQQEYTDPETGETATKTTAENMNVMLFNLGVEESFIYESLLYVNYIIESVCTELQ